LLLIASRGRRDFISSVAGAAGSIDVDMIARVLKIRVCPIPILFNISSSLIHESIQSTSHLTIIKNQQKGWGGVGGIVVPRPWASASLTGRRQKEVSEKNRNVIKYIRQNGAPTPGVPAPVATATFYVVKDKKAEKIP
jgi:hypothetical protein